MRYLGFGGGSSSVTGEIPDDSGVVGVKFKEITGSYSTSSGCSIAHGLVSRSIISADCLIESRGVQYPSDKGWYTHHISTTSCVVSSGTPELNGGNVTFFLTYKE